MNAENRQQNTTNHRAGSRPFSAIIDDVRREGPEENPYVGTFQRAYPHSEEDLVSSLYFLIFNFNYILLNGY